MIEDPVDEGSEAEALFGRIADEFADRLNRGERPDVEEYARHYPHLAGALRDGLPMLEALREPVRAGTGPAPRRLGDYLLLREIGRGGMGRVYEAEQPALGRRVAVKVLPWVAGPQDTALDRFRREAQAVARLHHTNIVPVFGVGEQDGVHFYAMQLIDGQGLDQVIAALRLQEAAARGNSPKSGAAEVRGDTGVRVLSGEVHAVTPPVVDETPRPDEPGMSGPARTPKALAPLRSRGRYADSVARIGLQVADALAYAHSQGVLHRDIKPSNLLLDARGAVWVTDFGLAKAEGLPDLTASGDRVGTLRYLSPEQLDAPADARSDVYALGLTLYELLTLRPAFDAPDRDRLLQQVARAEPAPPRKLAPDVPRDLETIVLTALAREPARRYPSAAALAEDLRRFLADQPVAARRLAPWERAWRWCRRNPGIASVSAAALAALLIGLGGSLWQWSRAERHLHQAETSAARAKEDFELAFQAIDQMLERVGMERLVAVPYMDQTRRALVQDAVRFYQNLLRGKEHHPEVRFATARAYCRLGQIHGWLNEHREALGDLEQALAAIRNLLASDPDQVEYRHLAATTYFYRGKIREILRQFPDAETDFREALAVWTGLSAEPPDQVRYAYGRTCALHHLGHLLWLTGRLREAESFIRQSLAVAEALPDSYQPRYHLLTTGLNSLASVLEATGEIAERERVGRRALEFAELSARENPEPHCQYELTVALRNVAMHQVRYPEARAEAEKLYLRSLEISERLVAEFPDAPAFRNGLAQAAHDYGLLLSRGAKAASLFERSATIWKDLVAKYPEVVRYRVLLGGALHNVANQRWLRGDPTGARALYEEAIGQQETVLKTNYREARGLQYLGNHYWTLVDLLFKQGQVRDAEQAALRFRASAQELAERDAESQFVRVLVARACETLAQLRRSLDQRDAAVEAYAEAAGHWQRVAAEFPANPQYSSQRGAVLNNWAIVLRTQGRWADMIPLLDEAIGHQEAAIQADPNERTYQRYLHNHYLVRADAQIGLGHHAQVAAAATAIGDRFPNVFDDFLWAEQLARCIPLAEKDPHLSQDERNRLAREYADRSIALLRSAQQKKSKDLPKIHSQPAFQPLRGRADFQKLLAEVAKPAK